MRTSLLAIVGALTASSGARAQTATIAGEVVAREGGEPLPPKPYAPRGGFYRGQVAGRAAWIVLLPELPDLVDTAFTNNHCFRYAGQERFGPDSVVRVDFEPVPWLAKDVDLEGSVFLRVDDYQLVGLDTRLNRIPSWNRTMVASAKRARFSDVVSGVSVLAEWEITNRFRGNRPPFVYTGKVTGVRWLDSTTAKRDTVPLPPR